MKSLIAAALVGLGVSAPAAPPVPPADTAQVDVLIAGDTWTIPPDLTMRARVAAITPEAPTDINWRWGGEGLGGSPRKGIFGFNLEVGQWSEHVPVVSLNPGSQFPRWAVVTRLSPGCHGHPSAQSLAGRGLRSVNKGIDVPALDRIVMLHPTRLFLLRKPVGNAPPCPAAWNIPESGKSSPVREHIQLDDKAISCRNHRK